MMVIDILFYPILFGHHWVFDLKVEINYFEASHIIITAYVISS